MSRVEKDSLGEVVVEDKALWGAHTQRALENFPISGIKLPSEFIKHLALIKKCYALAHGKLGLLSEKLAVAIAESADEVINGMHYDQFPLDVFQTGSGTSTNMNCNEVLANLAILKLGGRLGDRSLVHPNDHVNMSQSSNDVIPSCAYMTAYELVDKQLKDSVNRLQSQLGSLEQRFATVVKLGRTHLQDAVPITVGQEISGWRRQIEMALAQVLSAAESLLELPLGGTAVGTGLNCDPRVPGIVISMLCEQLGSAYRLATNRFALQSSLDPIVGLSAALVRLSVAVYKMANDLRHLSSGPRGGIAEYVLPTVQAGSSIMPGKSNPVILESAIMAACFVMGLGESIKLGGLNGNFQLNTSMPLLSYSVCSQIKILSATCMNLVNRALSGLKVDEERCRELVEKSPALCTPLAKVIGYDRAAEVFKLSVRDNLTVREAARKMGIIGSEIPEGEADQLFDVSKMV